MKRQTLLSMATVLFCLCATGATAQDELTVHRLTGAALATLGSGPPEPR